MFSCYTIKTVKKWKPANGCKKKYLTQKGCCRQDRTQLSANDSISIQYLFLTEIICDWQFKPLLIKIIKTHSFVAASIFGLEAALVKNTRFRFLSEEINFSYGHWQKKDITSKQVLPPTAQKIFLLKVDKPFRNVLTLAQVPSVKAKSSRATSLELQS